MVTTKSGCGIVSPGGEERGPDADDRGGGASGLDGGLLQV